MSLWTIKTRIGLKAKWPILIKFEFSRQSSVTISNIKFYIDSSSGSRDDTCGRKDRYDEANRRFLRLPPKRLKTERLLNAESTPWNRVIKGVLTVQGSRETSLYVLDCLFSVLIVGTLVVFVWRGAWTILDLYLYPHQPVWSAWASIVSTNTKSILSSLWIWLIWHFVIH